MRPFVVIPVDALSSLAALGGAGSLFQAATPSTLLVRFLPAIGPSEDELDPPSGTRAKAVGRRHSPLTRVTPSV